MTTTAPNQSKYSLRDMSLQPIRNWHQWLQRLEATDDPGYIEKLLEVGFQAELGKCEYNEPEYNRIDRLLVYFQLADGWADHRLLEHWGERHEYMFLGYDSSGRKIAKSLSQLRQQLATKAFAALCQNLFHTPLKGGGRHGDDFDANWAHLILSKELFPVIRNFFRAEEASLGGRIVIRNLQGYNFDSELQKQALAFITNLATFLWEWCDHWGETEATAEFQSYLDAAKPWMAEVLARTDRLDVLRKWMLQLDVPCIEELTKIALEAELSAYTHPVNVTRKVENIDEACLAGSKTALFVKEYAIKKATHERLSLIKETEQEIVSKNNQLQVLKS